MMLPPTNRVLILTGAGYTKNFDGFLASEMWAKIFNNPVIQSQPRLRELFSLQGTFDFEDIYSRVFPEPEAESMQYNDEEKAAMQEAVDSAYQDLDSEIKDWGGKHPDLENPCNLEQLLELPNTATNIFFTLNQDLLMERYCRKPAWAVPHFTVPRMYSGSSPNTPFEQAHSVNLPSTEEVTTASENLVNETDIFVKLHGSYGWKSANGEGRMVLGKNKPPQIENEPILKAYFDIFEEALNQGDKRLLVVGYGFRDEHINLLLIEAVKSSGLKLYIINKTQPSDFFLEVPTYVRNDMLRDGIGGYFPYTYADIFPGRSSGRSTYFNEIKKALHS